MICTGVAPDEVFTVRTKATRAAYGPILVFKFHPTILRVSVPSVFDAHHGWSVVVV